MKLSYNEMKSYLKHVVDLESSIYMQEKALQRSKDDLKLELPPLEHIEQPVKKQLYKPSEPKREEISDKEREEKYIYIIALFLAAISEIIIVGITAHNEPILAIVYTLIVVLMSIVSIRKIVGHNKKTKGIR